MFQTYPDAIRDELLYLRQPILEVAAENPEVGQLDETLKWGQISYRPLKEKVGTTIRIDQIKNSDRYAMYVPCTTTLLDKYRSIYADTFDFEGGRNHLQSKGRSARRSS